MASSNVPKGTTAREMNSKSTQRGDTAAQGLFDELQRQNGDPTFEELSDVHVEADNMKMLLRDVAVYLAVTKIQDRRSKDGKLIGETTKGNYLTKIKELLKEKFPKHEAWPSEGTWFPPIKAKFESLAIRDEFNSNDEFMGNKAGALYNKNSPDYAFDSSQVRDLEAINMKLIAAMNRTSHDFDEAAPLKSLTLNLTHDADGRGGEVKFLRWDKGWWDHRYQCWVPFWREIKTLKEHLMPFAPSAHGYALDIHHAVARYAILSGGLYRGDSPQDIARAKFVFPQFHSRNDNYVANLMTKTIKKYVEPDMKADTSSRSLRVGASTALVTAKDVTLGEALARSGHSTGTNIDPYLVSILAASLPGMRCLAGWKFPREEVFPPRLECLGADAQDSLEDIMNALYTIGVPEFRHQGKLRPLLRTATATVIMYYVQFRLDHGPYHPLTESVENATEQGMKMSHKDSRATLEKWSAEITADFKLRNLVQEGQNQTGSVEEKIDKMATMIQTLSHHVVDLTTTVGSLSQRQHELENMILEPRAPSPHITTSYPDGEPPVSTELAMSDTSPLPSEPAVLDLMSPEEVRETEKQSRAPSSSKVTGSAPVVARIVPINPYAISKSTSTTSTPTPAAPTGLPGRTAPVVTTAKKSSTNVAPLFSNRRWASSSEKHPGQASARPAKKARASSQIVNASLKHSSKAEPKGKGVSVADILIMLHQSGKIHVDTDLETTSIPSLSDQAKYRKTMAFVQTLWTADERNQLSNSNLDRNVAMKIVTEIANRVRLNIAKMNGKDAADPRQRSYYLGVANNLEKLNWKKPTT